MLTEQLNIHFCQISFCFIFVAVLLLSYYGHLNLITLLTAIEALGGTDTFKEALSNERQSHALLCRYCRSCCINDS